jgi:hypothetical protein
MNSTAVGSSSSTRSPRPAGAASALVGDQAPPSTYSRPPMRTGAKTVGIAQDAATACPTEAGGADRLPNTTRADTCSSRSRRAQAVAPSTRSDGRSPDDILYIFAYLAQDDYVCSIVDVAASRRRRPSGSPGRRRETSLGDPLGFQEGGRRSVSPCLTCMMVGGAAALLPIDAANSVATGRSTHPPPEPKICCS